MDKKLRATRKPGLLIPTELRGVLHIEAYEDKTGKPLLISCELGTFLSEAHTRVFLDLALKITSTAKDIRILPLLEGKRRKEALQQLDGKLLGYSKALYDLFDRCNRSDAPQLHAILEGVKQYERAIKQALEGDETALNSLSNEAWDDFELPIKQLLDIPTRGRDPEEYIIWAGEQICVLKEAGDNYDQIVEKLRRLIRDIDPFWRAEIQKTLDKWNRYKQRGEVRKRFLYWEKKYLAAKAKREHN